MWLSALFSLVFRSSLKSNPSRCNLAGKSNLSSRRVDSRYFRFCIPRKTRTIGSTASAVYSCSNEFHTFSNSHAATAKLSLFKIFETRSRHTMFFSPYLLLFQSYGNSSSRKNVPFNVLLTCCSHTVFACI